MDNESTNVSETTQETQKQEQTVDTKSLEAKIKALEAENGKLRQANTNASADASEWKKKYQAKLSDDEKAKEERETATAAMQKELEDLRNERNIAKYAGALVANDIGMDADTANEVAMALNAGEIDKVFDGIRRFINAHDKALREDALRNNKTLPGGGAIKTVTQAEFDNMSYTEMLAFKRDNPEQFAEFTK
jgi:hypothetical protein